MSLNLIGGFFNRLEASRKYLFGSMGVLGETNNSIVSGVFITRGNDIKLSVECAADWESYEYKRLDLTNDSDKKYFEGALAWDLELDGKKWADGKNVSYLKCVSAKEIQAAHGLALPVQVDGCIIGWRCIKRALYCVLSLCLLLYLVSCTISTWSTQKTLNSSNPAL